MKSKVRTECYYLKLMWYAMAMNKIGLLLSIHVANKDRW